MAAVRHERGAQRPAPPESSLPPWHRSTEKQSRRCPRDRSAETIAPASPWPDARRYRRPNRRRPLSAPVPPESSCRSKRSKHPGLRRWHAPAARNGSSRVTTRASAPSEIQIDSAMPRGPKQHQQDAGQRDDPGKQGRPVGENHVSLRCCIAGRHSVAEPRKYEVQSIFQPHSGIDI